MSALRSLSRVNRTYRRPPISVAIDPLAGMVRVGEANSRLRALGSVGIAVNNVINGGKNDLRRNGLAG